MQWTPRFIAKPVPTGRVTVDPFKCFLNNISVCLAALLCSNSTQAAYYFDPAFLGNTPSSIADLSKFETVDSVLPGTYRVDLYLNGKFIEVRDVLLKQRVDSAIIGELSGCFTPDELIVFDINPAAAPALADLRPDECIPLETLISGTTTTLHLEKLRLDVSIPQAMLRHVVRGQIPVEEWDPGINAFLLNYNFTGAHVENKNNSTSNSYFLNLNSGLNLGMWRLKNYSTLNRSASAGTEQRIEWNNISSYALRSLPVLKSRLLLGQASTSSDIFRSFGFTGMQLSSDDNMLADSQRGFAPVIRGVANSNAEVIVRQNGNQIYQTYVPPGAFLINDLYSTSSNGDLQVSIIEADGRVNQYSVPYASLPILQRDGQFKYDVVVGQYRGNSYQQTPDVYQGTLAWGLSSGMTLYGGIQASDNYKSYAFGLGQNLGHWGALSLDITAANSLLANNARHNGQSARLLYAKTISRSGTHFKLAGYQYSTRGFYTLNDTTSKLMERTPTLLTQDGLVYVKPEFSDYFNLNYPKRSSAQLTVSQPLGKLGSMFVSGNRQTFWNTGETTDLLQAGYQTAIKGISYNITYNFNKNAWANKSDQFVSFGISFPLGDIFSTRNNGSSSSYASDSMHATLNQNISNEGHARSYAGVSGTALHNSLGYSLQQGYSNTPHGGDSNLNVNYRTDVGNLNAGYGYGGDSHRLNYGMSGGLAVHENGVTLSQPLGETNVLIRAPGAKGVKLTSGVGIKTDARGYAIMPSVTNYRENRVALDVNSLANNIELNNPVAYLVPTQGALVRADFDVRVGVRALLIIMFNGQPVPFGASVTQDENKEESIVGNNGQVFLSGLALTGQLKVKWAEGPQGHCTVDYQLAEGSEHNEINKLTTQCAS
ncbi:fimbria/pilus outer membrane usher protein [Pseudomonas marginalis]|uniref:fimbria/pilus outer membrane usher protein n=1 Tax=Pseudomonas marginalis TaxID=298 RepID=UPI003B9EDB3D